MGMLISDRRFGSTGLPSFLSKGGVNEDGERLQQFLSVFLLLWARIVSRENRFGLRGGVMYGLSTFSTVESHLEMLPLLVREGRECNETKHELEEEEDDETVVFFFLLLACAICFAESFAVSTTISAFTNRDGSPPARSKR
jgi:hypothetical protein